MEESIGTKLRLIRFAQNLTQEQVAKAIGMKITTISKYENDKIEKPRLTILKKLANYYEVPIDQIIVND